MPSKNRSGLGKAGAENRIFVDTSAWVAFFSGRDQHHREADQAFRATVARDVSLLTTNLIVAELHRLLLFRAGVVAASAAIARIDSSDRVTIIFAEAGHHRAARGWLDRLKGHRVTYTDAVSFSIMEACSCRAALTYDNDFAIAGFAIAHYE